MLFNVALFSSLLLSLMVLAVPSGLGTRIARRGESSQGNNRLDGVNRASANYSSDWAGAIWIEGNNTFRLITGSFTVPTPSGPIGSSAAVWVGIDGLNCTNTMLQTGIKVYPTAGPPSYAAWYEWYPALPGQFSDPIKIAAGDELNLTVVAWSSTYGTVKIENLTNGQFVSKDLNSSVPLCGRNAEWMVSSYGLVNNTVPLADFGTVTFTNAVANGVLDYSPYGAIIMDIAQNGTVLTNVTTNEAGTLTIQYGEDRGQSFG